MICASCGTENVTGAKFCSECAARLALICPSCATPNNPTAKFCSECATPLAGAAPPRASRPTGEPLPAAPIAVAERRLVSVLFADLVGFTTLTEGRDSEDTRELLTRYFDLAGEVVGRYGGVVEKFIGDAVMAVWGAPTAREDDAERAVRAALELVDAVRGLGPAILARAGVLTGEAAVTLGATNQGMVAGDLVNTASRLQSVAPPGAVLVGEATYRAASRAIVFEEVGDQVLKGKVVPVPAWRAIRVVAERGGRNRSDTLEAPFVGRDEELRLLKDLYHATVREGRTRLVSVTGIGGIGKSRLAWEFEKYLDGLVDQVWWHRGRSPAYGEGITFWALGEMVRARAGLAETDDERVTRTKIAAMLAVHVPAENDRRWIEPSLLALLGVGEPPPGGRDALFAAWRTFFERLAASGTVVLLFEDLHWADSGLLDFIDHLIELSRTIPMYIVTLGRPELLERRPDWGAGRRNFTSLYLEPLPAAAMRELLAGLVPGLPEPAIQAVVARAEGVPLYAVETVRMLVAEGKLTGLGDGTYAPTGDLGSLAVPETLTALIAARLDSLDPADRSLVLDAAVLGQSFTPAGLAAISGLDVAELEPRLRSLVRRELLTHVADPRSPERGQYAFVQALIREVAYNTLARRDRKVRHLAVARWFESLGDDELAGALAVHYLAAHENAAEGAEADALAAQARLALSGAAERAAALGAHDQSVSFLVQALTVTTDEADEAQLLERAGTSMSFAGRYSDAETFLERAIGLQRGRGDRPAAARTMAALGGVLLRGRRSDRAVALLEPAVAEFSDLAGSPAALAIDIQLASAYAAREQHRQALEVADRVLEAAERADLVEVVAEALVAKGSALASLSRAYEGLALIEAARRLAETHNLPVVALRALGRSAAWLGADPRTALETERTAADLARRLGRRDLVITNIQNASEDAIRVGEWDWALATLDGALADDLDRADRVALLNGAVDIRALRGEPIADALEELEALVAGNDDPALLAGLVDARAWVAFAAGDLEEARGSYREQANMSALNAPFALPRAARAALWERDAAGARSDLEALDATGAHGQAFDAARTTIRAGLAALEGQSSTALAAYRDALQAWRDLGLPWDEALTALDMATLLDLTEPEVQEAAETARQTFARLGARPFITRLEAELALAGGRSARS